MRAAVGNPILIPSSLFVGNTNKLEGRLWQGNAHTNLMDLHKTDNTDNTTNSQAYEGMAEHTKPNRKAATEFSRCNVTHFERSNRITKSV